MQPPTILDVSKVPPVSDLSGIVEQGDYMVVWGRVSQAVMRDHVCRIESRGARGRWRVTFRGGRGAVAYMLFHGLIELLRSHRLSGRILLEHNGLIVHEERG